MSDRAVHLLATVDTVDGLRERMQVIRPVSTESPDLIDRDRRTARRPEPLRAGASHGEPTG